MRARAVTPTRLLTLLPALLLPALLLPVLLFLAPGCPSQECTSSDDCGTGFVCTEGGTCQEIFCTSSLDCPIEAWCNNENGQCEAGCLNDNDCRPTAFCDQEQRECVEYGCRNTTLDCNFGEFCNEVSGRCVAADGYYCQACIDNDECGSGANVCMRMPGSIQGSYCGVDCSAGQACPAGYFCGARYASGGVLIGNYCMAPCWEHE